MSNTKTNTGPKRSSAEVITFDHYRSANRQLRAMTEDDENRPALKEAIESYERWAWLQL